MHEKALKEGFFIKNQNHTHISLRDLQAYRIDTVENKAHRHVAISLGTIYHNIPWPHRPCNGSIVMSACGSIQMSALW